MGSENFARIDRLKHAVQNIPDTADVSNIWQFLGWSEDLDSAVEMAANLGQDLNPLFALAPDFRDIVSIVVTGAYGFPYNPSAFDWSDILSGKVHDFPGRNPKERILSVLECVRDSQLHS